jgi:hypothetical protein
VLAAAVAAMVAGGCVVTTSRAVHVEQRVGGTVATTMLSPHGEWVAVAGVGHVWRPYHHVVGVAFVPYVTGGRWIYTTAGWEFESRWDWGWRVFHYGNWIQLEDLGWVWMPGNVWAPAWVEWRMGGGYVGWAPIPPPGMRIGAPPRWWFVPAPALVSRHWVETEVLPPQEAHRVFEVAATPVRALPGYPVSRGPPPHYVERHAKVPVEVHPAPPPGWQTGKREPPSGTGGSGTPPPPGSSTVPPQKRQEEKKQIEEETPRRPGSPPRSRKP